MSASKPASRQELINYCLRQLGGGVVNIGITEAQLEDRLDEALQQYQNYHFDATERTYLKHQITCSEFDLESSNAQEFQSNETVVGQISGAEAVVYGKGSYDRRLRIKQVGTLFDTQPVAGSVKPTFVNGETILGKSSGVTGVLSSDPTTYLKIGDTDNKWIPVDDSVISVIRLLPFSDSKTSTLNPFDVKYQLRMSDLYDLYSTSLTYYTQVQQHLSLIDRLLIGEKPLEFSRHKGQLRIDMDWIEFVSPDQYLIAEVFKIVDPETYTQVYNDQFLKKYLTALLKRQWGQNLSLYTDVAIIGGIKLDGWQIFNQGNQEVQALEQEMQLRYTEPPMMFMS